MQPFSHHPSAIFGKDQHFLVAPSQAGPRLEGWADPTSHNFASAIEPPVAPRGQWNGLRLPCQDDRAKTENEIPQHIPGHPAATQFIRPVTDQDWKDHRARITEIYWEQDKDLNDVIKMMKSEHGIRATERQCKRKFMDWNLRKNTSTNESWAMIRIRKRRKEQEGKLTIFKLREREVPSENLNRFAKRRKLRDGEALPVMEPLVPHLTQSSVRVFERAEDVGHVDQSLTARRVTHRPFDTLASEHLQVLHQSPQIQDSVFAVTPERTVGSDEYTDPSPTTLAGTLNHASSASLTTDITDKPSSNTVTYPSNLTPKSRSTFKEALAADPEVVDLAATPKAYHRESEIGLGTTKEWMTTGLGTRPESIDNGRSYDGMDAGGFITTASPAPSSTDSEVYATPMSVAVDSHAIDSESDSDDYATPMDITADTSSNTPRPDAENCGTPMDRAVDNTWVISEQGAYPDDNATPKNTTADYLSPTPESEYATPMEIAITSSIAVSEKWFDDELRPGDFSVYERSVKLTARARISGVPIEAIEKRLRFAAKVGDLKAVEELLRRGATIDARSKAGMSALHLATYYGHSEVLRFLLDMGAMLDSVSSQMDFRLAGRNLSISDPHPVHLAALRGHRECTDIILERSSQWENTDLEETANMDDDSDLDLLGTAVENDHVKLAEFVIRSRGKNWFRRYEWDYDDDDDYDYETPLAIAARNGSLASVSLFLDHGLSPNIQCERDMSLLWIASARGHEPIVDFLLQHHAIVDLCDYNDLAPMDVAIAEGHGNIAKKLLKSGASANNGRKTSFGLYFAVAKGDTNMVRLLLAHGWNPNARYQACMYLWRDLGDTYTDSFRAFVNSMEEESDVVEDGWTPLHLAVHTGCEDMVTLLLQNGASLTFGREDGLISPVRIAGERGHAGVLRILRNHVADEAWTPLGLATFNGCAATVKTLLGEDSNPNLYAYGRQRPLHIAVDHGLLNIAKLLLEGGADAALISPRGSVLNDMTLITNNLIAKRSWLISDWHLMHLASGVGDVSALWLLLQSAKKGQHLVRIKSPTERNETALHVAARAGHLGAVRLLANADRPSTRIVDSNMDTPLHVAVKSSHLDIARELFQLGGVAHQLTYKNEEFEIPHYASSIVLSSPLAKDLLELLFCSALYLRDHGPRKGHEGITNHVKNRSAAIWIHCKKYDDGALEAEWLRLVALSLSNHDEVLFKYLVEIMPDIEAACGLDEQLLSCFKPIYDVSQLGHKRIFWDGIRSFMEENVNLFSSTL
ncbi:ankyrin [Colletotrichum sublineola]|nr:ankyrin [Colletotrichum sublineola]